LRENVQNENDREIWRNNWLIDRDEPAHTSQKTTEFVTNNNIVIIPNPPYLPELAPYDFSLFPKLKMKLKRRHFKTVSDNQRESQAVLNSIKENYFHGSFKAKKKNKKGWNHCIRSQGGCFE
jgi:transposase